MEYRDSISFFLGERIKTVRLSQSMNQREFARKIGIGQPTLSGYEKGNALPSLEVLMTVASQFDVSIDWLLGRNACQAEQKTRRLPIEVCLDIMDDVRRSFFTQTMHLPVLPEIVLYAIDRAKAALRYCKENQVDLDAFLGEQEERLRAENSQN